MSSDSNKTPARRTSNGTRSSKTTTGFTFVVLAFLILCAMAWIAGMPKGVMRIATAPAVSSNQESAALAVSLFENANVHLTEAERYHHQISVAMKDFGYSLQIPTPAAPDETGLRHFLSEMTLAAKIKDKGIEGNFSLNPLAILEKSYEWIGLNDYYLIFREINKISCNSTNQGDCWNVVIQYWPSRVRPETFSGSQNDIGKNIGLYALRGAIRIAGDNWRSEAEQNAVPPMLMFAETPDKLQTLESTADAFELLMLGLSHPLCLNQTRLECIDIARRYLQDSLSEASPANPVAAYGLSLVELDSAFRKALKLSPELDVERHLGRAERLLGLARQSEFIRSRIDQVDLEKTFSLLDFHGIGSSVEIMAQAREFSCAMAHYRRADWKGCIQEIRSRDKFAPPLRPYLDAALVDAELMDLADDQQVNGMLEDVISQLTVPEETESDSKFLLRKVAVKHVCQGDVKMNQSDYRDFVGRLITSAPSQVARREIAIMTASCPVDKNAQQENVGQDEFYQQITETQDEVERGKLFLVLASYFVRRGEFGSALDAVKSAIFLPWAGDYVLNAAEFKEFRGSQVHFEEFLDVMFATTAMVDLERCHKLD